MEEGVFNIISDPEKKKKSKSISITWLLKTNNNDKQRDLHS